MLEKLNDFELGALTAALSGSPDWMHSLRSQIPLLYVKNREYTSAGGYTDFVLDAETEGVIIPDNTDEYPPIASVKHPMLIHGGSVVVWTKNGKISILESIAEGDGEWPVGPGVDASDFSFSNRYNQ